MGNMDTDHISICLSEADGGTAEPQRENETDDATSVIRKETKAVFWVKVIILLILVIAGLFVSIGTFLYMSRRESNNSYQSSVQEFQQFAENLLFNLEQGMTNMVGAMYTLSITYSTYVTDSATSFWPNVTLPHFLAHAMVPMQLVAGGQVLFAPLLVNQQDRTSFEAYAQLQQQSGICAQEACLLTSTDAVNANQLYSLNNDGTKNFELDGGSDEMFSPIWQGDTNLQLFDQLSNPVMGRAIETMLNTKQAILSNILSNWTAPQSVVFYPIFNSVPQPNNNNNISNQTIVGSISAVFTWSKFITSLLPSSSTTSSSSSSSTDAVVVLETACGTTMTQYMTFEVTGNQATFVGFGDLRNPAVTHPDFVQSLPGSFPVLNNDNNNNNNNDTQNGPGNNNDICKYSLHVSPLALVPPPKSGRSVWFTVFLACVFFVAMAIFLVYDWLVERRQSVVMDLASRSSAIVESLFPAVVRERMFRSVEQTQHQQVKEPVVVSCDASAVSRSTSITRTEAYSSGQHISDAVSIGTEPEVSLKKFLQSLPDHYRKSELPRSQPIADMFPNTTVLFGDIAGFTAWSSEREPSQVFTLLETVYQAFDTLAHRLGVFKVETIGDCYMAVTGLPDPNKNHAVAMARFAYECLIRMQDLTKELEVTLGPGTTDLALRIGMHSGPVTAGVLRGEKSRFQLFGDTVNTASRMESTGQHGKIQVSEETAHLLMAAGKSHWIEPREELVVAKGKGELQTFWLEPKRQRRVSMSATAAADEFVRACKLSQRHTQPTEPRQVKERPKYTREDTLNSKMWGDTSLDESFEPSVVHDKYTGLIDWNVDVLLHHLARVVAARKQRDNSMRRSGHMTLVDHSVETNNLTSPLDEVAEVIIFPRFDPNRNSSGRARAKSMLVQQIRPLLHDFVSTIASMYRDVPFHNFEHASHVTLSANKLINRLVMPEGFDSEEDIHNATYGISSDPLTHFAIIFAALIHDVDHNGVPNAQLMRENAEVAIKYKNSIAEQNSVHIGWEILMQPRYQKLRACIYQTAGEKKRFRQVVINSVMATDIADKEVNMVRKKKWDKAFRSNADNDINEQSNSRHKINQEEVNRRATAVIEHIIQVSDVAHTMQHWHIYQRWNERLFQEMYAAYIGGRAPDDPTEKWYEGELGFFDFYLIPLGMKMKECGVFGASGDEYLSYAQENRKEWQRKGKEALHTMMVNNGIYDDDSSANVSLEPVVIRRKASDDVDVDGYSLGE